MSKNTFPEKLNKDLIYDILMNLGEPRTHTSLKKWLRKGIKTTTLDHYFRVLSANNFIWEIDTKFRQKKPKNDHIIRIRDWYAYYVRNSLGDAYIEAYEKLEEIYVKADPSKL
jgi:hypothetical protein